jgi:Ca2+-binding RTX toxin-like protein
MKGAISLGGGNDTYHGHGGRVLGNIDMQGGADVIDLRGGTVSGTVAGGNGADTYYVDRGGIALVESFNDTDLVYAEVSFRLADRIENLTLLDSGNYNGTGNSLDNLLNGNSGDNRLTGFSGNDTANGDLGNDRLLGGTGNDSLTGDDGEDTVIGHAGADSVRGGEGDDSLNGGAGKDLYVGNDGADTFAFTTLAHTANTQATCDVISDFITGDDLISVLSLDANKTNATPNDTFTWVGTSAFVNGTAGVLRYVQSGGNTYVEMELTGDALSDGMIKLTGLITLSASDFVL